MGCDIIIFIQNEVDFMQVYRLVYWTKNIERLKEKIWFFPNNTDKDFYYVTN